MYSPARLNREIAALFDIPIFSALSLTVAPCLICPTKDRVLVPGFFFSPVSGSSGCSFIRRVYCSLARGLEKKSHNELILLTSPES